MDSVSRRNKTDGIQAVAGPSCSRIQATSRRDQGLTKYRAIFVGLALLAGQLTASAADLATLRNGSSIPFIRKEQIGDVTRLYITGGHMDVPTSEIVSFDKDDSPVPPANSETESSAPAAPAASASATAAPAPQAQPATATTSTVALKTQ